MGWVRLSDDFYDNSKFELAGPLGMAMWAAGLAWCNRNLTDGLIPRGRARGLLDFEGLAFVNGMQGDDVTADWVLGHLVMAGLWEELDFGYRIHDYHKYQPTREKVLADRERERKRWNRRSGSSSDQTPDGVHDGTTSESAQAPYVSQPQTQDINAFAQGAPKKPKRKDKSLERLALIGELEHLESINDTGAYSDDIAILRDQVAELNVAS